MPQPQIESSNLDRRSQILDAALVCFAKRGFHQASMHDISAEAGISVGLIYRYFENKEAVISAMAGSKPCCEAAPSSSFFHQGWAT